MIADLPEAADLLALAVEAGLTVGDAVALVGARLDGPVAIAMRRVHEEVRVGRRLTDALAAFGDRLGAPGRHLAVVLADGERSGSAVGAALHQVAREGRERRRRQTEEAARRLPVKLLFPLVGCVLPAFALLTVVPVVAGALRTLHR